MREDAIAPVAIEAPTPRSGDGIVRIDSTAHGARWIAEPVTAPDDGQPGESVDLGAVPIDTKLAQGRWRIRVEGEGYQPWSREVDVRAGEVTELSPDPPLIEGAWLTVIAETEGSEGAEVFLDGDLLCSLPCRVLIEPGDRTLTIRKRLRKPLEFQLQVVQADSIELAVTLKQATSRAPAIITGTVGLGALATGIGFTVAANRTRRSLANDLANEVQYDANDHRIADGRRDAVVAGAMYGIAGAVGALTLFYLLRQPGVASRGDLRRRSLALDWSIAPAVGRGSVGLTGVLRF